jgi:hypothetical protein
MKMFRLFEDAKLNRRIFFPFGPIPEAELNDWLHRTDLVLPPDLLEFWRLTGGGDIFDTETILRPTVPTPPNACFVEDEIEGFNAVAEVRGKSPDLYLFCSGLPSAVRLSDQKYVTLNDDQYTVDQVLDSFDEWYVQVLREEFAAQYGLPLI